MNRYSYTTDSTYQEGNNSRFAGNTMDEIITLIKQDMPEGRQSLKDSFVNLEKVAEYCEDSYMRSDNKRAALEETKNFTTQSLASVAYQINTLASNYIQLLDLQTNNLGEMESQMNYITQAVNIHKEKVARREIGILTANKVSSRQYKIVAPSNPEKPIKYVRKPIDYGLLDEIGHGLHHGKQMAAKRSSAQSSILGNSSVPPPTTKPPTPPSMGTLRSSAKIISGTGTIGKSRGSEYRPPAQVVPPPQVPSHYAPNFPIGHPRRQNSNTSSNGGGGGNGQPQHERPGYSALPQMQQMPHPNHPNPQLLHPLQHQQSHYDDRTSSTNMPPPPSPLTITHNIVGRTLEMPDQNHIGLHTLSRNSSLHHQRQSSSSPPLPPPPPEDNADFGRPRVQSLQPIVPDDQSLPGWVPKNYIEKVVAIYDYYADKDDELSFQESSVIYVLKKNDDGWWEGVMDSVTGLFPGNYVEPCV